MAARPWSVPHMGGSMGLAGENAVYVTNLILSASVLASAHKSPSGLKWRITMRNKKRVVGMLALAAALLCGCQAAPETAAVTSKNDGTFEAALENTAKEETATEADGAVLAPEVEMQDYTNSFTSMDGNITYDVDLALPIPLSALPVLQVTPHTFTVEEAKRIAQSLFGDVEIYEYSTVKSKTEIEEEILALRQHISDRDALVEYYDGLEDIADVVTIEYENRIALLEEQYRVAPETVEVEPCSWEFHPQSYYNDSALGVELEEGYDNTQALKATVWVDDTPYVYWVSNRDAADYRIHNIYAYIDDLRVSEQEKVSTEKFTQEDIDEALAMVNRILEKMDIGTWAIDSYSVNEGMVGNETVYALNVSVCPVYSGVKAIHLPQLENLKSEDAYASNYYFEEINFQFSGGRMISFEYFGPLDVVSVLNDNVAILSGDEIMSTFESQMKLDDITGYQIQGIPEELADQVPQVTTVEARVDTAEFGLVRTRIKDNASDFYLLPAYSFSGTYSCCYSTGDEEQGGENMFATINAVDGSIINTQLGY